MYCGYIVTIKELRKHNNADRLQCTEIFQNNVIVDLSYKVGQRCVFFPVDGQLSEEFANENNLVRKKDENGNNVGGYLDPNKCSISALRLRGEKSEGLLMPIETLSKYTDINQLKDGDQITVLNGVEICRKYIPKSNKKRNNGNINSKPKRKVKIRTTSPFFEEHIDTQQLVYNQRAFKEGDIIYITRKLHGTSGRTSNSLEITKKTRNPILKKVFHLKDREKKEYHLVTGTRRTVINSFDKDTGYYGTHDFRKPYHDFFKDKLPKGFEVFYEIVGWVDETTPIMSCCNNALVKDKEFSKKYGKETIFTYGCEPGTSDIYVYRMTMTNEDGVVIELPTEEVMYWCDKLGVKFVPVLEKFIYTTWEDLNERCDKYLDIPEPLANGRHVVEGVVVRIDNRDKFTAYKKKSFAFKVLEGIIKDTADAPDMEEAEELITEEN